jgi:hypothetical protein
METFRPGERGNVTWLGTDIVDYRSLEPGNVEMCSFCVDGSTYSAKSLILDCTMPTIDYQAYQIINLLDRRHTVENRGIEGEESYTASKNEAADS